MKVDRAIMGAAAAVQFSSLVLVADQETRLAGFILGMVAGLVLLMLALGIEQGVWVRIARRSDA